MIVIATLSLMLAAGSIPVSAGHTALTSLVQAPQGGLAGDAVYVNGYQNDWQFWGWGKVAYEPVKGDASGGKPIKVDLGPWQAIMFHHESFNAADYSAVSFRIHGGTDGGQTLWFQLLVHDKVKKTDTASPKYFAVPAPKAGVWTRVVVPLKDLQIPGHSGITGFWLQSRSETGEKPFYVNDFRMVKR